MPQVWRAYSIANAPRPDGTLDFHVRRVPGGELSGVLVDHLGPGSVLRLGPALGQVRLPADPDRDLLFVAGGTGWAPAKALLEAALAQSGRRTVRLLLGATSEASIYDVAALEGLAAAGVEIELAVEGPSEGSTLRQPGVELLGALSRFGQVLNRSAPPQGWPETYVSGPPGMVEAVTVELEAFLGVDPDRVHADPAVGLAAPGRGIRSSEWFLEPRETPWIRPRA